MRSVGKCFGRRKEREWWLGDARKNIEKNAFPTWPKKENCGTSYANATGKTETGISCKFLMRANKT